ncbi:MAG: SAM-dependent chlorinase/fluorinase [Eubacteriales bacterium]|nr:SAM-dependent chlorinase/fluorinase [Eubacteriales bacterium]
MKHAVVMQTDFGVENISVSTMRGVCRQVSEDLDIFDSTHAVRPFDVLNASDSLVYTIPFWPEGTVFVSVVDPGVGTSRRSCVARLKNGSFVVTPDNGTLTYVVEQLGVDRVREIDESVNRYPTTRNIHIFHGRDVYAYCAARLAAGVIDFEGVGPEYPVSEIVMAPYVHPEAKGGVLTGMINEAPEHFGLTGTNIPFSWLAENGMNYGDMVHISILHNRDVVLYKTVPLVKSFGYTEKGTVLVISSETGTVMIAKNQGNLVLDYQLDFGPDWTFSITKA